MKDAEEFLRDVSICNEAQVNIDEWVFAFAKLGRDQGTEAVDAFVLDFETRVKERGRFADFKTA
jgi:hypothetical protein